MRYVNNHYISAFKDCIAQTSQHAGYTLPEDVEAYCAILLGSFVDRPDFLPADSFAESYLRLTRRDSANAKELADICLFVVSVFPDYGVNTNYYIDIGKSSYDIASKQLHYNLFQDLCQHFEIISEVIRLSTTPRQFNVRIS